jgi:hypothetical protein
VGERQDNVSLMQSAMLYRFTAVEPNDKDILVDFEAREAPRRKRKSWRGTVKASIRTNQSIVSLIDV